MKTDNAKLADIVRVKESEISAMSKHLRQKDEKLSKMESNGDLRPKTQHGSSSRLPSRESEDLKRYYESEMNTLNKQVHHIQKMLAMNLSPEEKVRMLQNELQSVKDFNVKKLQIVESRLQRMDDGLGSELLPTTTMRSESSNENLDPKLQSIGSRELSELLRKPMTSQSGRKPISELSTQR